MGKDNNSATAYTKMHKAITRNQSLASEHIVAKDKAQKSMNQYHIEVDINLYQQNSTPTK